MPRFGVIFDGKWQGGTFYDLSEAVTWGKEVADTGRMVWIVEKRWLRPARVCNVFPEEKAEEGEALFRNWRTNRYGSL